MTGFLRGGSSHRAVLKSEQHSNSHDQLEEHDSFGLSWYFSRKEIEENSPSRRDGIDLKKETYLRKSYCTFLQDLGIRLKVPQVTIASAIVFCHRFFFLQSHSKNDRRTIATVCMFLAGKVEETPRPLKDVILVSYEIIHKKDPSAVQRIKQKEVYEQQKELILLAERVVLSTIGFDLNVHHPYKPLVAAIKKINVAQNALAQVAWNFVNDGLRTSLCLQFKAHHIAAGAIFLAAKFLKVKLPSDGEKVWWQEFDVTPRQLEDVSNQMLELYEQNHPVQSSQTNDVEGSTSVGTNYPVRMPSTAGENVLSSSSHSQPAGIIKAKQGVPGPAPAKPLGAQPSADHQIVPQQNSQKQSIDTCSADTKSGVWDQNMENEVKPLALGREITAEISSCPKSSLERPIQDGLMDEKGEGVEARDWKVEASLEKSSSAGDHITRKAEGAKGSPRDVIENIDKGKVKAALEKQKKSRNNESRKSDLVDEDDLIEMELEKGIELAVEDDDILQERRRGWPKPLNSQVPQEPSFGPDRAGIREQQSSEQRLKSRSFDSDLGIEQDQEIMEEGELTSLDERDFPSPKLCKSNEKAVNTRSQQQHDFPCPLGENGDMPGTGMERNHDDHSSTKLVKGKAMSMGRLLENKRPRDLPDQARGDTGTGWVEHTERDLTRQRRASYG